MAKRLSKARAETKAKKEAWKTAVKENWNHKCCMCGKTEKLQCHHVTYRKELKWNPAIGILLCCGCHKLSHNSAHKEAIMFYFLFDEKYPDIYDEMLDLILNVESP